MLNPEELKRVDDATKMFEENMRKGVYRKWSLPNTGTPSSPENDKADSMTHIEFMDSEEYDDFFALLEGEIDVR